MSNNIIQNVIVSGDEVIVNNKKIKAPPKILGTQIQVIENNKIYMNYKELKGDKWKTTMMSIFKCLF